MGSSTAEHTIEPELLLAAPRPVRLRRPRTFPLAVTKIVVWLIMLAAIVLGVMAAHILLVVYRGIPVVAVVTGGGLTESSVPAEPSYYISYSYSAGATTYSASTAVATSNYRTAPVGSQLTVLVSPVAPAYDSVPTFNSQPDTTERDDRLIEALLTGVIGIVLLWIGVYQPARMRELVRRGIPTVGTIVDKKLIPGKSSTYQVTYDYSDANLRPKAPTVVDAVNNPYALLTTYGSSSLRRKMAVSKESWSNARVGDKITVLFSPEVPTQSVIYAFSPYEVSL